MTEAEMARLYVDYGYVLFRRCLTYLGDETAAQDAVQEVFVRALGATNSFRGESSARTWLCRIADNLCLDILRHRRRYHARPESESDNPAGQTSFACEMSTGDDREALLGAHRLLDALKPDERRLAVLYYIDELTQDEIAAELGLSRRTVGKRVRALLEQARKVLQPRRTS
jgi:RNA polymerase sigma-70 factor (ECF subfamily)